jgi:lipoprotein-releasing system permease protein
VKNIEWYIAGRYLASRRKGRRLLSLSTFIAIGGVAVGVMALLIVIAVMTGMQRDLQEKILGGTPHIYVYEQSNGLRLGNWPEIMERVRRIPGVVATGPTMQPSIMIARSIEHSKPGVMFGVAPGTSEQPLSQIERDIMSGKVSLGPEVRPPGALPGVIIGSQLAQELIVFPGDTVLIATIEHLKMSLGGLSPALRQYEVTGIENTGMYEYDNLYVYARIEDVQDLLGVARDTIGMLAVNVAEPWNAKEIANRIQEDLGMPYLVNDWMTRHGPLFEALALEKLAAGIILSLIILVAAFNIVSLLTMVVADKRREIGILKSMGMTDGEVLRIFMAQGLAIGAIGTLIGIVLGVILVEVQRRYGLITLDGQVYFINKLPVALDAGDVLKIVAVSLAIAFGATIYPALQAARMQPVDAIRED